MCVYACVLHMRGIHSSEECSITGILECTNPVEKHTETPFRLPGLGVPFLHLLKLKLFCPIEKAHTQIQVCVFSAITLTSCLHHSVSFPEK